MENPVPTTEFIQVTPELAQEMINTMGRNRKIKEVKVAMYARDMLNGKWKATHQGLAFDPEGVLIDGQHRLQAVIRSNMTIGMNVSRGISADTVHAIDVGTKRSAADVYEILGGDKKVSAALIAISRHCLNGPREQPVVVTHDVLVEFGQDHEDIIIKYLLLARSKECRAIYRAPWVSGFVMAALVFGEDAITPILERLSSMEFHGPNDPVKRFYVNMANIRDNHKFGRAATVRPFYLYQISISLINAMRAGRELRVITRTKKDFPRTEEFRRPYLLSPAEAAAEAVANAPTEPSGTSEQQCDVVLNEEANSLFA